MDELTYTDVRSFLDYLKRKRMLNSAKANLEDGGGLHAFYLGKMIAYDDIIELVDDYIQEEKEEES